MQKDEIYAYIKELEQKNNNFGLAVDEFQILMALRIQQFNEALEEAINEGWIIDKILRVYYSQNMEVLEVLARLHKGEGLSHKSRGILITMTSDIFEFISVAKYFSEPEGLKPEGKTFLPFIMTIPSIAGQSELPSSNPQYKSIIERRERFFYDLDLDGKRKVAGTCTDSKTCSDTTESTIKYCKASTTPPQHNPDEDDIRCDTFDTTQDCPNDVCDDSNTDE